MLQAYVLNVSFVLDVCCSKSALLQVFHEAQAVPQAQAVPRGERAHTTRNIHFYDENFIDESKTVIEDRFLGQKSNILILASYPMSQSIRA